MYTCVTYKYIVVQQNLLYKLSLAQEVSLNNLQYGSRMWQTLYQSCYRWFSWGVASLLEGKSWCLHSVQLCAECRRGSATSSPYHQCWKIKKLLLLTVKCLLYSCLLIPHLPFRSRTLNHLYHLKTLLLEATAPYPTSSTLGCEYCFAALQHQHHCMAFNCYWDWWQIDLLYGCILAPFPGPVQLPVACSMVKWERIW